jgi:hypothetical protein
MAQRRIRIAVLVLTLVLAVIPSLSEDAIAPIGVPAP